MIGRNSNFFSRHDTVIPVVLCGILCGITLTVKNNVVNWPHFAANCLSDKSRTRKINDFQIVFILPGPNFVCHSSSKLRETLKNSGRTNMVESLNLFS